ncbi:hypothetical protein [Actinomadura madurae]|uniref:hypothetical protein n=1 Tax=Actinomadura madurae TaxID=1993 RepID=UPI0020D23F87|nr:hypothetical protein [Actinomadura madurae]MCQ0016710.1 hypothetical protein [Actinomadura madurae]
MAAARHDPRVRPLPGEHRGEHDAIRERYLLWAFATAADLETRLDADWRSAFDGVADDLRAAAVAVGSDPAAHGFVRTLAHLTFAAGRFVEARTLYQAAARCATGVEQGQDLRAGAYAALSVADNRTATELMRQAVEAAGTADLRAEAVVIGVRYDFGPIESPTDDQARLLAEAQRTADANQSDQRLAALVAMAKVWHEGHGWMPDLGRAHEAVELARAARRSTGTGRRDGRPWQCARPRRGLPGSPPAGRRTTADRDHPAAP